MLIATTEIQQIQKQIIAMIKALINNKNYEPGDKLPSERMLAEKFEVTRSNIRGSIQTLEFYGLVKSIPQSGTFVADIGITALNGMIDDILNLPSPSFKELVEARIFLELKGVKLAALRRTEDDLIHLENALAAYSDKVIRGEDAVQEDTFMLKITPEIITNFEKHHVCDKDTAFNGIQEHKAILDAIRSQDPLKAKNAMKKHFGILYQFCYNV